MQPVLGYHAPSPEYLLPCNEMCHQIRPHQQAQHYEVLQELACELSV